MDNPKKRGVAHIQNKKKYKPRTGVAQKTSGVNRSKASASNSLDSNWDRYESEEEDSNVHSLSKSTDFSLLSSAAITTGSRFQFKSEKDTFGVDQGSNNSDELFQLDLNYLSDSLATVPFMTRSSILGNYFTEQQKKVMRKTAADNMQTFIARYDKLAEKIREIEKINDVDASKTMRGEDGDAKESTEDINMKELIHHVDLILNDEIKQKEKNKKTEKETEEIEGDLDEWLDQVLNDSY